MEELSKNMYKNDGKFLRQKIWVMETTNSSVLCKNAFMQFECINLQAQRRKFINEN